VSGPKAQRGGKTILFRDPSGNILEVFYPSIAEWQAAQTKASEAGQTRQSDNELTTRQV